MFSHHLVRTSPRKLKGKSAGPTFKNLRCGANRPFKICEKKTVRRRFKLSKTKAECRFLDVSDALNSPLVVSWPVGRRTKKRPRQTDLKVQHNVPAWPRFCYERFLHGPVQITISLSWMDQRQRGDLFFDVHPFCHLDASISTVGLSVRRARIKNAIWIPRASIKA